MPKTQKKMFEVISTLPSTTCNVSTSYLKSKAFYKEICAVYVVYVLYRRVSMDKNRKYTFFVIISLQLVGCSPNLVEMFFLTIPMQCPSKNSKFENFRHFIGGSGSRVSMGRVLYRTFAGMVGHDQKKDSSIFFFHKKGKGKKRTYPK